MNSAVAHAEDRNPLGKLKSFGLKHPWQVALLLPSKWEDLTRPLERFDDHSRVGEQCVVIGGVDGTPQVKFQGGPPRLVGWLCDAAGNKIGFSAFGDTRALQEHLKENSRRVVLLGTLEEYKDSLWLKNAEAIPEEWVGRLRPCYPGKTRVINPETVRDRVMEYLNASVSTAANFLASELKEFGWKARLAELAGMPGKTLEDIILEAHIPPSVDSGLRSQEALEYLASLGIVKDARSNQARRTKSAPQRVGDWRKRASAIPFKLTDEQERATVEILADVTSQVPMRRVLTGDVGCGKSAPIGCACAAVVDGGGTAVILQPNEALAAQMAREFDCYWPDIGVQLVTGSTSEEITSPFVVGTTALLFRMKKAYPTLLVTDEQHRFGTSHREELIGPDTNSLEVSATAIPRTQALIRYGVVKVSKLKKTHTPKDVHTRIWQKEDWRDLFAQITKTVKSGAQVLLVYPMREKVEQDGAEGEGRGQKEKDRYELGSVEEIYAKWAKIFPGRVRYIHGNLSADEKNAVLMDMNEGRADILVATTIIECGLNLDRLRRVLCVHPERHGLSTLHQLRGRLCRRGGEGWMDLLLMNPVKDTAMERLRVLETTLDGFRISELDMKLRGIGDISSKSTKQSGSNDSMLFGRSVRIDILDRVMKRIYGD